MSADRMRVIVAVSGSGRTLARLIAASELRAYQVVGVVSSAKDCPANDLARSMRLPLFIGDFSSPHSPDLYQELRSFLKSTRAEAIALGGFVKLFPILTEYAARTVNIHPALLPAHKGQGMYGMAVHRAVYEAKGKLSGASVHLVTEGYDEGPILAQAEVVLQEGDTPDTIAAKVFAAECDLYPRVLDGLAKKTLPLSGGQVMRYRFERRADEDDE